MGHTAPLLQMGGICKSFGSAQVLREVDLRLDAGEVLALLGANGAGKSTLVKILCGVYSRDAGTVRLDDQSGALRPARRGHRPRRPLFAAGGIDPARPHGRRKYPHRRPAAQTLVAWQAGRSPSAARESAGTARPARLRPRSRRTGTPALRTAQAPSRDRPRSRWPSADHRHGRADRLPRRPRSPSALRRRRAAQGAADRHHLHLSLP